MAITQTGSSLDFTPAKTNTGTVSTTITVPADAEIVIVGWSSFTATALFYSTGAMTFTKGGADTAMTAVSGGDDNDSRWQGALFYLVLPDTGSNKTLKWDWLGAGTPGDQAVCSITFWKGIDTASPVRNSSGGPQVGAMPFSTGPITALTNDLIVAWAASSTVGGVEATFNTWSNLTLLSQVVHNAGADAAWATTSPTGDTTIAVLTGTNTFDGCILGLSLKPAPPVVFTGYVFTVGQSINAPITRMIGY